MNIDKTVLIVYNKCKYINMIKKVLSEKHNLIFLSSYGQAFDMLMQKKNNICSILVEVNPKSDYETEFLSSLNKIKNLRYISKIAFCDKYSIELEKKVLKSGADDFVTSFYDEDILKYKLNNAINSEKYSIYEKLQYRQRYDVLTGIHNKVSFLAATSRMIKNNITKSFAFVTMDINRFSLINLYFGINYGNNFLRHIAGVLSSYNNDFEHFTFGRIDNDEFAFCFNFNEKNEIVSLMKLIRKDLQKFARKENINLDIIPSYGICILQNEQFNILNVYDNSKLALKKIKGNYINNYEFYNENMGEILKQEQLIINEMNVALQHNEFEIYIQPKYNMENDDIYGGEVLVRWNSKEKGMILPSLFIPIFERTGFIQKLDYYVWENTCKLIKKWIDKGIKPMPLSVNVSRINLYNPNLVDMLCDLIKKYNIPASMLNLEITESAYTKDLKVIREKVSILHKKGFIIMMDDFGSGYSSLNVLKDMEFDIIKIDMNFISECSEPERGEIIVYSVVQMAKYLNIPIIAEGAENKEQVDFLKKIGCEYVQGYYYAKPMSVENYEQILNIL